MRFIIDVKDNVNKTDGSAYNIQARLKEIHPIAVIISE